MCYDGYIGALMYMGHVHCARINLCTWPDGGFVNRSKANFMPHVLCSGGLERKPIAKPGWFEQAFLFKPFP